MGIQEKIKAIEEELASMQYHKGTEHHFGKLKAKLAKLRESAERQGKKGAKRAGVRKGGDATVVIVGNTLSGKSSLFNKLTGANSEVSGHLFTTRDFVPGMMKFRGANIQVVDTPALEIARAEVLSLARSADLVISTNKDVKVPVEVVFVDISGCDAEKLKERVYEKLKLIRVYMKPKRGKADYEKPLVLRSGAGIRDVCKKLGIDAKGATVWGRSVKFGGQEVSLSHVVEDGDVITLKEK